MKNRCTKENEKEYGMQKKKIEFKKRQKTGKKKKDKSKKTQATERKENDIENEKRGLKNHLNSYALSGVTL